MEANDKALAIAEKFYAPIGEHEIVSIQVVDATLSRFTNPAFVTMFDVEYVARCENARDQEEPF